jgi:hypothetical protein
MKETAGNKVIYFILRDFKVKNVVV